MVACCENQAQALYKVAYVELSVATSQDMSSNSTNPQDFTRLKGSSRVQHLFLRIFP